MINSRFAYNARNDVPSVPTSFDPELVRKYLTRRANAARVGTWRTKNPDTKGFVNDGPYIDPDWYIVGE